MATEQFSFTGDSGTTHYLAIFNAAGEVFDWSDSTFKALGSATTKATTATEQAGLGGTSKSAWIKDVDLSTLNNTSTPAKFRADWYTDANATVLVSNTSEFTVASGALTSGESSIGGMDSPGADITSTANALSTYGEKLDWIFAYHHNAQFTTSTVQQVCDDSANVVSEAGISSDGTTVTRNRFDNP